MLAFAWPSEEGDNGYNTPRSLPGEARDARGRGSAPGLIPVIVAFLARAGRYYVWMVRFCNGAAVFRLRYT